MDGAVNHDDELDDLGTPEEMASIAALSQSELQAIDAALLGCVSTEWRKVARIVGAAMLEQADRTCGISDIAYSRRVQHLVEAGVLESQGNLSRMRFSEVRLARRKANAT
jgi:hypothetical protein